MTSATPGTGGDCDRFRPLLTGYLDGDLDADAGADVRGHLRECAACRGVADDEAALRDGLRALPTLDPPPAMWSNIRAQLAQAEVASSKRPAWRRALARWTPAARVAAPYAGALAAAALALVVWRVHERQPIAIALPTPPVHSAPVPPPPQAEPPPVAPVPVETSDADVTADLARDAARRDLSYEHTADRLEQELVTVAAAWPDARKKEYAAHLGDLRAAIASARDGAPRRQAWGALVRYLQGALVRDEVALQ